MHGLSVSIVTVAVYIKYLCMFCLILIHIFFLNFVHGLCVSFVVVQVFVHGFLFFI